MFTTRVRGLGIILAVLLGIAGSGSLSGDAPRARADEPKDARVKELLKERLAVLQEVAKLVAREYQAGKGSIDRLRRAQMAVIAARVELCDTDKERIAVLEEAVALARNNERLAAALDQTGNVPASDPLLAKADRLEAEIALERAKAKTPAKPE
jgi:outer membrane protein TolC